MHSYDEESLEILKVAALHLACAIDAYRECRGAGPLKHTAEPLAAALDHAVGAMVEVRIFQDRILPARQGRRRVKR